jgi:hypothetical protein
MGKDDVRRALEAMGDDGVRGRLATGDFSAVDGLDLSDHERQLVQDAAADYPEVAGFDVNILGGWVEKEGIKTEFSESNPAFQNAALYSYGKY